MNGWCARHSVFFYAVVIMGYFGFFDIWDTGMMECWNNGKLQAIGKPNTN
jgi:hypothetical protein